MSDKHHPLTRILSIGNDKVLLSTRKLILEREGYAVCSPADGGGLSTPCLCTYPLPLLKELNKYRLAHRDTR